jgi:selenium-binding protein 1
MLVFVFALLALSQASVVYVWNGHPDGDHIATVNYNAESSSYGQVLHRAFLPTNDANIAPSGNEPHHIGISANFKYIVTAGLGSFLQGKHEVFVWTVDRSTGFPSFSYSLNVPGGCPDEFVRYNEAGTKFLLSMMCNEQGSSPGNMVLLDVEARTAVTWDHPATPLTDYNPHGFAWDPRIGVVVADFVQPVSLFTNDFVFRDTIRYFNPDGSFNTTVTFPTNNAGYMDVKFLNNRGTSITSGTTDNRVWLVNPWSTPQYRSVLNLADNFGAALSVGITRVTHDRRRMVMTFGLRYVVLFNIDLSNSEHPVTVLSSFDLCNPVTGVDCSQGPPASHYVQITPDENRLIVSNYFVQVGNVILPGSSSLHSFRLGSDRDSLTYEGTFHNDLVYNGKKSFPHGMATSPL